MSQMSLFDCDYTRFAGVMPAVRAAMRRAAGAPDSIGRKGLVDKINLIAGEAEIRLTGGQGTSISKDTLDKWLSPSDTSHPPSVLAVLVFCRACEDFEALRVIVRAVGMDLMTPEGKASVLKLGMKLKEQGAEDKFYDVLEEVPRVRKDLGEPPLVTPSSQIVGTQAVFNVLMGERYKVATKETKDVLLGKYGQTVKPFNPEVVDKVLGDEKKNAITCRPADLLEPELDKIEAEMKQWKQQDEDVLSYALFPQVATEFFKYREAQQKKVDATIADTKNGAYPV